MGLVVIPDAKVVFWKADPQMRWHADLVQMPPELQQLWVSSEGQHEWRKVPLHVGKE